MEGVIVELILATSPIVKRISLNNVASSVVKRFIAVLTIKILLLRENLFHLRQLRF